MTNDDSNREFILMVGNIGAGKTKKSQELNNNDTEYVSLDKIGIQYVGENGEVNMKKLEDHLNRLIFNAMDSGKRIIYDGNLMKVEDRYRYPMMAKKRGYTVICYDFGPGNEKQLLRRINESPEKNEVEWRKIYCEKKKLYQKPTYDEWIDIIYEMR